ncbi:hypothetical protein [Virgibacillus siamensis]|uniref:hypothetical protein n=1 Tax=Virgibacillus siamensis TaxID=480071 RepID=UPI0009877B8F|nr:hypothetical protein [Virgibacillus siamensis]
MYIPVRQSLLAELAIDSQRSSYLALNSFMGQGTMIITGGAITLGGLFPATIMSSLFLIIGLTGVTLMANIIRQVTGTTRIMSENVE